MNMKMLMTALVIDWKKQSEKCMQIKMISYSLEIWMRLTFNTANWKKRVFIVKV
jgi:hypothetical protein